MSKKRLESYPKWYFCGFLYLTEGELGLTPKLIISN